MRKDPEPPKPQHPLRSYLEPFIPLLVNRSSDHRTEALTNKAYHLGTKEFAYTQTLTGHLPVSLYED